MSLASKRPAICCTTKGNPQLVILGLHAVGRLGADLAFPDFGPISGKCRAVTLLEALHHCLPRIFIRIFVYLAEEGVDVRVFLFRLACERFVIDRIPLA